MPRKVEMQIVRPSLAKMLPPPSMPSVAAPVLGNKGFKAGMRGSIVGRIHQVKPGCSSCGKSMMH